ncbi:Rho guanine nucleotide exchange factor scd1 [Leucoagaricus sp. SymC.cos]|nr:Rho guanine nucleotide exchange factor scd1 [Leucoagaricus sp. SymC.cos]
MASVAGRKKSIVSSAGLHIETPVAHNTLLNKAANQSTSLYQQCSSLRARLLRIHGFSHYFALAATPDSRQSTDPVTQLWDLFSIGISLCYIFDQLPADAGFPRINHSEYNPDTFEANPDREKKHAIALFAMQVRSTPVTQAIPECEPFTVRDIWDRDSTDGLVKVINTVTAIVDYLPPSAFESPPPSPPSLAANDSLDNLSTDSLPQPVNAQEQARNNIIREMVETERKYVQDLETMQKYSNALAQGNFIDQDTIHLLFPNLNKLLNFQRKFLIRLESTAEAPWQDQRWGLPFIENEDDFVVYEPYCANYTNASELMLTHEQSLMPLNHLINVKGELPAFLIKPVQRVCKYPLLLDSLIKTLSPATYSHYEELKRGSDAAKRITDKINEAQRRAENDQTVKSLSSRIDDWKGHHLENFGGLLLDDIFTVTKSDIDREYHVFLFEKIILCCKEVPPGQQHGNKKMGKNNSLLKKQASTPTPLNAAAAAAAATPNQRRNTPLLLKGRIFLGNVTQAVPSQPRTSTAPGMSTQYALAVWWKGDDDLEYFTLKCRNEEQMRKWESQINRLIKEAAQRRGSDRGLARLNSKMAPPSSRATSSTVSIGNPSTYSYSPSTSYSSSTTAYSASSSGSAKTLRTQPYGGSGYGSHDSINGYPTGPFGYPYDHDGFTDDEEYEDYPQTGSTSYIASGRGTPINSSRKLSSLSMPAEQREPAYDQRTRAYTENADGHTMQQWRNQHQHMPPPPQPQLSAHSPGGTQRPMTPRTQSDMTFGAGASQQQSIPQPVQPSRSRSASQPNAYNPQKGAPPPLPTNAVNVAHSNWTRDHDRVGNKRGSGSSQSTGGSSEYSPNSSSPITPFGSSDSSLGGAGIHVNVNGHHMNGSGMVGGHGGLPQEPQSPPVKVKVHFHEDIFVIQVPRSTEYDDLVEKVGKKIRLCGPRRDDGPLRVKYRDEDGDMVSLGSTEDVQIAFEAYKPGGQVTLFVT